MNADNGPIKITAGLPIPKKAAVIFGIQLEGTLSSGKDILVASFALLGNTINLDNAHLKGSAVRVIANPIVADINPGVTDSAPDGIEVKKELLGYSVFLLGSLNGKILKPSKITIGDGNVGGNVVLNTSLGSFISLTGSSIETKSGEDTNATIHHLSPISFVRYENNSPHSTHFQVAQVEGARLFADPSAIVKSSEDGTLVLQEGEVLLEVRDKAIIRAGELACIIKSGSIALVSRRGNLISVRNLSDRKRNALVCFLEGKTVALHQGEELRSTCFEQYGDQIARRNTQIIDRVQKGVELSEVSLPSLLLHNDTLFLLSSSNRAVDRAAIKRILKTSACLEVVTNSHGPYRVIKQNSAQII